MSKSVTVRLSDEGLGWADSYASERGVSRTVLLENALRSFRENCESGTPELEITPEVKLKPGECPVVRLQDRISYVRGPFPTYGEPVEPPGALKFVCSRGDCGWTSEKIERCPEHRRFSVPRGSASRRIIVAPPEHKWTRDDFARLTRERAEMFSRVTMGAGAVIGGNAARDSLTAERQSRLNEAKGL